MNDVEILSDQKDDFWIMPQSIYVPLECKLYPKSGEEYLSFPLVGY